MTSGADRSRRQGTWIAAALLLSGAMAVRSAEHGRPVPINQTASPASQDVELGMVLVDGRRPLRDTQVAKDWFARLSGQFEIDGMVELRGDDGSMERLVVHGRSACESYFPNPGAQCELQVRWPQGAATPGETVAGGIPNLDPAIILFGYVQQRFGILHMLVDGDGIAAGELGYLYSADTMIAQTKCPGVSGNCERVLRVTAKPDLKEILVEINVDIDFRRAFNLSMVMRRAQQTSAPASQVEW